MGIPSFAVTLTDFVARSVCAPPTQATPEASRLTEFSQLPQHMWLTVAFSVGAAKPGVTAASVSAAPSRTSFRLIVCSFQESLQLQIAIGVARPILLQAPPSFEGNVPLQE